MSDMWRRSDWQYQRRRPFPFTAPPAGGQNATVDVTLDALTAAGIASVDTDATLAATLGALTSEAIATVDTDATAAVTLDALTTTAAASVDIDATLNVTLGALTLSGQVDTGNEATLNATLAALTVLPPTLYALRFFGNGDNQIDRVRIPLDPGGSSSAADVGAGDFTYECWLRCAYADNVSSGIADARESNIFFDRDIWGHSRGWVAGVTRNGSELNVCFGLAGASLNWVTITGTTDIGDNNWHHVAITRVQSSGEISIWVDGVEDASGTYTTGDLSYPDGFDPGAGQDNEYLVLGAEKHDADPELYLSYNGYMDELRISSSVRYTATFTPPIAPFVLDASTAALYHFDDGTGTVLSDSDTGDVDGELLVGGSPVGPQWNISTLAIGTHVSVDTDATASITLDALTTTAAASVDIDATLAVTLGALTVAGEATVGDAQVATLAVTLGTLTTSATASVDIDAASTVTLSVLTSDASAAVDDDATLAATLAALTLSSSGEVAIDATLSVTLGTLTLTAAGGSGAFVAAEDMFVSPARRHLWAAAARRGTAARAARRKVFEHSDD